MTPLEPSAKRTLAARCAVCGFAHIDHIDGAGWGSGCCSQFADALRDPEAGQRTGAPMSLLPGRYEIRWCLTGAAGAALATGQWVESLLLFAIATALAGAKSHPHVDAESAAIQEANE